MGLFEYRESQEISKGDPGFYALLFSLMRKADTNNTAKIKAMWPDEYAEMQQRYNAPGGALSAAEQRWLTEYNARIDANRKDDSLST